MIARIITQEYQPVRRSSDGSKKSYDKNKLASSDLWITTYYTDEPIETNTRAFMELLTRFITRNFGRYMWSSFADGSSFEEDMTQDRDRVVLQDGYPATIRRGMSKMWEFTIITTYEPELEYIDEDI